MIANFESEMSAYMLRLKQTGCSEETIDFNRRCHESLQTYLSANSLAFTMEVALQWLESSRAGWSHKTYCAYRYSLFRFEKYLLDGSIFRTRCYSVDQFVCRDAALQMPKQMHELFVEFKSTLYSKFSEVSACHYSQGCKDFLLFIAEQGCTASADIMIEHIVEYSSRFRGMTHRMRGQKADHLSGIVNLLTYLAERGDIPHCYSAVLPRDTAFSLSSLKLENIGTAFQPSKQLEPIVLKFLSSLDEMRYSASTKQLCNNDFTNFFLFLEMNHLEYSRGSIELWVKHIPKNTLWVRRRHTLTLFADYLETGSINIESHYTWRTLQIDSLPDWSRNIVAGFIAERQREGLSPSTLTMCRLAGYRFFRFLDSNGVKDSSDITPDLVKLFHNADIHATPESKNAYGIKVRQLLTYMAEQKLVPQNLFLAISTQCAPCRNIVSVMSAEMESAVFDYRKNASSPFELRNAAVVMLGLRMGLRASDIVNLKIENFNWAKRTVSFVQRKTRKAITLYVPTDVGNSVHKYVMEGRPQSGVNGTGYVFVRHLAPFGSVTRQICRDALKRILSAYGLELARGEGFHITRKTFASRLLTSGNSIDDISNALGHALQATAEVYLSRDEEGMHLCPLPFESVGVI